ncbi:SDR family NAD(P)-dependent oxidoreductase [Szabonella alba]|uniref:SDR family oxidoreductase n=1 Tax=Szabonella alba TaxID=2804194 RepID=A0A8K0XYY5_9RHOB|nr:SDR family NAD(P)-dependent oxidoreductase [Szabonella alba]MBL4916545.1 SDR family oxidoreductase [Szabonella alba]
MTGLFDLGGKRAFVTGGSRGLGREMALALAHAGADIALVARPSSALEETATAIRALGRTVWALEADIGNPEATETACHHALDTIGTFDILINNVGGRRVNIATEDLDLATWRGMMDLNLTSTYLCSRILGKAMIAAGKGGRIINIASINAMVAGKGIGGRHYEAAKAAVLQFTRTLAVDWAPHGITANVICPGIFATEPNLKWQRSNPEIIEGIVANIPMGTMGDPKDIGALALYLASDSARFMTGASLVIDGGYTCV